MITHKGTQEIKTKRFLLRKIKKSDYKDIYKYASNEEVAKYVSWNIHKNIEDTKALCKMWVKDAESNQTYHWAIVYNNSVIGNIEVVKLVDETAFMGWQVDRVYWNKGVMTECACAVRDYLFSQIGVEEINASYILENAGSGRVMEKMGMTPISPQKYYKKLKDKSHLFEIDGMKLGFYGITRKQWFENSVRELKYGEFEKLNNIWDLKKCPFTNQFKEELLNKNRTVYVLILGDKPVAECDFVLSKEENGYTIEGRRIYLSRLIVKKENRGTGLGQAMLEIMINKAKSMDYDEISVGVDKDNNTALHIYKKYSFQIFETAQDECGEYYKMLLAI